LLVPVLLLTVRSPGYQSETFFLLLLPTLPQTVLSGIHLSTLLVLFKAIVDLNLSRENI
jgi:hypothetical protein